MINNVSIIKKIECCGCTACISSCPKNAISMRNDHNGFIFPLVDSSKCVNCGICLNICRKKEHSNSVVDCFAARNFDKDVLSKSSSGGVSDALAQMILNNEGIVYGVVYDNNYSVYTKRITESSDLPLMRGSKYVQTNPANSFSEVYFDLLNNKKVIYFGTSCCINGLLSFLEYKKISIDNLITVDFVCHGVPSPRLFSNYIDWLKKDRSFVSFEFRTKNKKWGNGSGGYGCTITKKTLIGNRTKKYVDSSKSRVFLNLFFSNNCLREHCFECKFSCINKPADITIADFWGCREEEPDFFTDEGVSAVIVHTQKGLLLLNNSKQLAMKRTTIEKIANWQPNLFNPTIKPSSFNTFWNDYFEKGFKFVSKKYGGYALSTRIKKMIKKVIHYKG